MKFFKKGRETSGGNSGGENPRRNGWSPIWPGRSTRRADAQSSNAELPTVQEGGQGSATRQDNTTIARGASASETRREHAPEIDAKKNDIITSHGEFINQYEKMNRLLKSELLVGKANLGYIKRIFNAENLNSICGVYAPIINKLDNMKIKNFYELEESDLNNLSRNNFDDISKYIDFYRE